MEILESRQILCIFLMFAYKDAVCFENEKISPIYEIENPYEMLPSDGRLISADTYLSEMLPAILINLFATSSGW